MMGKILKILKDRDTAFIEKFCNEGTYMDAHGKEIIGVCRTMTAEEMLTFMHQCDARLVGAIKEVGI